MSGKNQWIMDAVIAALVVAIILTSIRPASAETKLLQKGYYEVSCDGVKVSQHTTLHKAYESALNQTGSCVVSAPTVVVERAVEPTSDTPATVASNPEDFRVTLTWKRPATRTNGAALKPEEIAYYRVYLTHGDKLATNGFEIVADPTQEIIERTYLLWPGAWSFAVSAVDTDGLESELSVTVSKSLPKPANSSQNSTAN